MSSCLFRKISHLSCHGVGTWGDGLKDFYGRLTKENNNELQLGRLYSLPSRFSYTKTSNQPMKTLCLACVAFHIMRTTK